MVETQIVLRDMEATDLDAAIELSHEQSWPHRSEDWRLFFKLGEGIVATVDDRVVGTIMSWRYGPDYATIGMVIVTNEIQKRGIGRKLMEAMLERLEGYNVLLNATQEGMPLYSSLGFVPCGIVHQHQGPAPAMPLAELGEGERVRPFGQADNGLGELYSRASGMDRSTLFNALARDSSGVVLSRNHEPVGFALLRRFGRGRVIAPLVAPDLQGAKVLVTHWLGARVGRFCRIDVLEGLGISRWLEAMGLPKVGTVTMMVRGRAPAVAEGPRVFGLSAQAFG
ncbi:N-acetyltransferase [Croceicoccus ponticola]|uniref:N-acetyltransferase n=1 Tax=Croceicoccus ponticola TaxID=2217664 RepID=A0A437H2F6_9SPHN|nr:GNAT family N-acetyltransferase [Croceicoccus ponticola]RVQ69770.1 N-acetyltransferase [Croceicoccus ponticola]